MIIITGTFRNTSNPLKVDEITLFPIPQVYMLFFPFTKILSNHRTDDTRTLNACQGLNFHRRDLKFLDIVSNTILITNFIFKNMKIFTIYRYDPLKLCLNFKTILIRNLLQEISSNHYFPALNSKPTNHFYSKNILRWERTIMFAMRIKNLCVKSWHVEYHSLCIDTLTTLYRVS